MSAPFPQYIKQCLSHSKHSMCAEWKNDQPSPHSFTGSFPFCRIESKLHTLPSIIRPPSPHIPAYYVPDSLWPWHSSNSPKSRHGIVSVPPLPKHSSPHVWFLLIVQVSVLLPSPTGLPWPADSEQASPHTSSTSPYFLFFVILTLAELSCC